jgi:hypothetical protein
MRVMGKCRLGVTGHGYGEVMGAGYGKGRGVEKRKEDGWGTRNGFVVMRGNKRVTGKGNRGRRGAGGNMRGYGG